MALADVTGESYMKAYCQTATAGNVTVKFAWFAHRMELVCTKCGQMLTAPKPEDTTTVDYAVQEFVKLHLHKSCPDYCSCEKCLGIAAQKQIAFNQGGVVSVKSVTMDFKPLQSDLDQVDQALDALEETTKAPDPDGYGLTNLPKIKEAPIGAPDSNPGKAAMLAQALSSFKNKKLTDDEQAHKIKLLQLSSQDKAKLQAEVYTQSIKWAAQAELNLKKVNQANKEKLELAFLKTKLNSYNATPEVMHHAGYIEPQGTPAPVKKDKPLKQPTGRKIR